MASRSIICRCRGQRQLNYWSARHWQITIFCEIEFNNCFIIQQDNVFMHLTTTLVSQLFIPTPSACFHFVQNFNILHKKYRISKFRFRQWLIALKRIHQLICQNVQRSKGRFTLLSSNFLVKNRRSSANLNGLLARVWVWALNRWLNCARAELFAAKQLRTVMRMNRPLFVGRYLQWRNGLSAN